MKRRFTLPLTAALLSLAAPLADAQAFKVLVFSKTAGFRHDSIPAGISAIQSLAAANDFLVDTTENAALFTDANLAQYDAVVFLCTTGDILNSSQQGAFERFIQGGKGYVGIHSASDTEYSWPWYGGLVGAYFSNHPAIQTATIKVADRVHPSTAPLPTRWQRNDEWYNFNINPRPSVHVLATLDESTYSGGSMGYDHPIAWCQFYDGGRAWYTAGGHTAASYSEPLFRQHLLGGIKFAAGDVQCDCGATIEANFQAVTLDANNAEPMQLSIAADGRVYYIQRGGQLKVWKPATQSTVLVAQIPVTTANEDGLLGIALDPSFASNGWVYLFYSPPAPSENRLSRFTLVGDAIQAGSERILLQIPTQREQCCHSAGGLRFGPDGLLYLSTGDNTNPFESSGYTPIDERPDRAPWDAQKSSSNRNDLRGKILRIRPQSDGTYTIPAGNLFAPDGSNGRPEIYVMGCRNPFRFSIDSQTNWLYWGDVGPDANSASSSRGPAGLDEINQTRSAGNYGWPYCIGMNLSYRDYNFATSQSGPSFNCGAPVNNSPNNTGAQQLPASQNAFIYYPYATSSVFPELGTGGRTALAGPVYHDNPGSPSQIRLPAYYDDTLFIYDYTRKWIKEVKLDENGNLLKINPFLPNLSLNSPIDMEIGPDGAIYLLEFAGGTPGPRLRRIEYLRNVSRSPVAVATATPASGQPPLFVQFSSAGSYDPDPEDVITYAWDFTSDGITDSTAPNTSHSYTTPGNYVARLTVTDPDSNTGVFNLPITVGNTAPIVTLPVPPEGGIYNWGDLIGYQASAIDAEDGSTPAAIPCSSLITTALIGHDAHAHPTNQYAGCTNTIPSPSSTGHSPTDNLYFVLSASYTDLGAPGIQSLTGLDKRTLRPKLRQAEFFAGQSGVSTAASADAAGGGLDVNNIDDGDWIALEAVNLLNIQALSYRLAAPGPGGQIEVRVDSPAGQLISTASVPTTGSAQTYLGVNAPITDPGGTHALYFVFRRTPGAVNLFSLNWIDFIGTGVANGLAPGADTPRIGLAPATIERTLLRGSPSPTDRFTVTNTLAGTLNYVAQSDASWLVVFPNAGSSIGEPDTLDITYETAGLPAGHYVGHVSVADPSASNTPQTLLVDFHFLARADFDADGDVDMVDFGRFQGCLTGLGQFIPPSCEVADFNADLTIDNLDFQVFLGCLRGANVPPGC